VVGQRGDAAYRLFHRQGKRVPGCLGCLLHGDLGLEQDLQPDIGDDLAEGRGELLAGEGADQLGQEIAQEGDDALAPDEPDPDLQGRHDEGHEILHRWRRILPLAQLADLANEARTGAIQVGQRIGRRSLLGGVVGGRRFLLALVLGEQELGQLRIELALRVADDYDLLRKRALSLSMTSLY